MKSTPEKIIKYLALIQESAAALEVICSHLEAEQLNYGPGPKDWSIIQNFAHLRSCAEVWTLSIYAMLVEDNPTLPRLHPRDWNRVARYEEIDSGHL